MVKTLIQFIAFALAGDFEDRGDGYAIKLDSVSGKYQVTILFDESGKFSKCLVKKVEEAEPEELDDDVDD